MKKTEVSFVIKSFAIWKFITLIPIFLAPFFFKLQLNFLGGGLQNYLSNPYFWSFSNFDGEHYINIARMGYANGEQSFFPLYPLLLKLISDMVGFKSPDMLAATGLFVSNIAFFVLLMGIYKLAKLDFSETVAKLAVLLIIVFPTSFYFGAGYTESLFLALVVWSFYAYRKGNYLLAGILGLFASSARVVGIILLPVYMIDILSQKKKVSLKHLFLGLIPVGLISYMFYSFKTWGDPIKFFNAASGFGEQRSDHLILLPQVFYRYVVKIIPNLSWEYFPVVFTTMMEIATAVGFLVLILFLVYYLLKKKIVKPDYWFYIAFGYLIPPLSGSFSSFPRYVLALFPAFIYLAHFMGKLPKYMLVGILIISTIILMIAQMLFVRGYFVS